MTDPLNQTNDRGLDEAHGPRVSHALDALRMTRALRGGAGEDELDKEDAVLWHKFRVWSVGS